MHREACALACRLAAWTEPLNLRDFEALARARMAAGRSRTTRAAAATSIRCATTRRRSRGGACGRGCWSMCRTSIWRRRCWASGWRCRWAWRRRRSTGWRTRMARRRRRGLPPDAGVMFCASTSSSLSLEEIAAAAGPLRWFQLYTQDDAGPRTAALVRRAEAAGYRAIVLTVDLAVSGRRERELREGFDFGSLRFGNFPPSDAIDAARVARRATTDCVRSRRSRRRSAGAISRGCARRRRCRSC